MARFVDGKDSSVHQTGPSRRAVLAGGGLLALVGCSAGARPEPDEEVDPDVRIRAEATEDVRRLVALYATVTAAHPVLRDELAPLAAETAAHLTALDPPPTAATGSTPPTGSPSATVTSTAPATAAAGRASIAQAERRAAEARVDQLTLASPALARLLAAIGASEATHASLLGSRR